jgi:hypothetical protein
MYIYLSTLFNNAVSPDEKNEAGSVGNSFQNAILHAISLSSHPKVGWRSFYCELMPVVAALAR